MTRKYKAYEENAPGDFYVEHDLCITCGNPKHAAPNLVGFLEDESAAREHCYFKKQPETEEEVDLAIEAVRVNCCGSFHYAGSDASIKKRLREKGCSDAIDHP